MDFSSLEKAMKAAADAKQAAGMSAYMRNQFEFLGVAKPKRKEICKEYFKAGKKQKADWDFVNFCWDEPCREFQYIAAEYLCLMAESLSEADLPKLKAIIVKKSWWDTVDTLDKAVGIIALKFPKTKDILLKWSTDKNIWFRRVAIDHQLGFKEKTDTDLFEKILVNNLNETEFFINKAIGWSLREYSKTDPEWVKNFIKKHKNGLSPLSIREGSKYIK